MRGETYIDIEEVMRKARPELDKLEIKRLVQAGTVFLAGWRFLCKGRRGCACPARLLCRSDPSDWIDNTIEQAAKKMSKLIIKELTGEEL